MQNSEEMNLKSLSLFFFNKNLLIILQVTEIRQWWCDDGGGVGLDTQASLKCDFYKGKGLWAFQNV